MADEHRPPAEAVAPAGTINGAATARWEAHAPSLAAHLAAPGEPHEHLDAARMREITSTAFRSDGLFPPAPR